jgi:hypothetical protein
LTGKRGFTVMHSAGYFITGDGTIFVDNAVSPTGPRIPLARIGVRMILDAKFDRFAYLGRGPMENYPDRKTGSDVGLYRSTVRQQMTPYAKPGSERSPTRKARATCPYQNPESRILNPSLVFTHHVYPVQGAGQRRFRAQNINALLVVR